MIKRYRFRFSMTADKALASLDSAIAANPDFGLAVDANGRIKVFRSQGLALLNGFFPIFVGRFNATDNGAELCGGFRFHLLAIGLFAAFVASSAFSLIQLIVSPEAVADLPADWTSQRIRFELQFIAFAALAVMFAWLAGKPMRQRIESIITGATTRKTGDKEGPS
jgi:hypothetical protein